MTSEKTYVDVLKLINIDLPCQRMYLNNRWRWLKLAEKGKPWISRWATRIQTSEKWQDSVKVWPRQCSQTRNDLSEHTAQWRETGPKNGSQISIYKFILCGLDPALLTLVGRLWPVNFNRTIWKFCKFSLYQVSILGLNYVYYKLYRNVWLRFHYLIWKSLSNFTTNDVSSSQNVCFLDKNQIRLLSQILVYCLLCLWDKCITRHI